MAGSPIRRARREGKLPPAPNPGAPKPVDPRLEAARAIVLRVRARARQLPTDAQLLAYAKAVLWDVAEHAIDPADRSKAAKALFDATKPDTKSDESDGLDKLPAAELQAEVDRAKRALGEGDVTQ